METNKKALDIADLIARQKRDELSEQEKERLRHWLNDSPNNQALYDSLMHDSDALQEELDFLATVDVQSAWQKVAKATGQPEVKVIPLWQRFSTWRNVAAVIILVVVAAALYTYKFSGANSFAPAPIAANTVQSEQLEIDRATLILHDGSKIDLDSLHSGTIREVNGVKVVSEDGMVKFDASAVSKPESGVLAYNTIATPKGRRYQVVLPDGSKVWLNAASSLKFPVAFTESERRVELKGEAYFEVVKDTKKRFIVDAGAIDVAVLGTSFNVSAYEDDEEISTTLVTGHVQLAGDHSDAVTNLTPGKRAVFSKTNKIMNVSQVDTDIYIVWREGKLYFEDEKLETIMTKLNRWYDVDAVYLDQVSKNKTFTGVAFTGKPIDHLLSMITQATNVSFEKKGEQLLIKKK